MTNVKYVRCPRCDLNYIMDTEEMCDICKAETGLISGLVDELEEEDFTREVCPVCKRNFINYDEEMCEQCLTEKLKTSEESDDDWRTYLDDESEVTPDEDIIPLEVLAEEERLNDDEEEEEVYSNEQEDDFEEIEIDDDYNYDFDDDDEDDDE